MKCSILLVDDDPTFQNLLAHVLKSGERDVTIVGSAKETHERLKSRAFDLVLLDLGLPDEDGLVLLRQLRARSTVPVIVLTSRKETEALLSALELGADDYITKPFDPREVLLRVNNIILRSSRGSPNASRTGNSTISFGGLTFDGRARTLYAANKAEIRLTAGEFNLLEALIARPGWALSRDQLLDAVAMGVNAPTPRMVDVFVSQLRAKIEVDRKNPRVILTVRGHGYKFADDIE